MIVTTANKIPCENRNTELLLQEIQQISPTIRFYIPGEELTENQALMIQEAIMMNQNKGEGYIYVPVYNM